MNKTEMKLAVEKKLRIHPPRPRKKNRPDKLITKIKGQLLEHPFEPQKMLSTLENLLVNPINSTK